MFEEEIQELINEMIRNGAIAEGINGALEEHKDKIREIFVMAVEMQVYDYYTPKEYPRREIIRKDPNALNITVKDGVLTCLIDTSVLNYYTSAVTGKNVSELVWGFMANDKNKRGFSGHDDGIGERRVGYNQYHRYEKRNYLELAKSLIELEFGVPVQIINTMPSY